MFNRTNQQAEKPKEDEFCPKLIELSADAVLSYEKYLLDKIDHKQLAKTMKTLREHIEKTKQNFFK
jgi:hypothetical protein